MSRPTITATCARRSSSARSRCWRAALAPAGDDLERLGAAYLAFAVAHPQLYRTMFALPRDRAASDPALAAASGRAHGRLRVAVERHLAAVGGRLAGPTTTLAAWAYVHGLASLAIDASHLPRS